MTAFLLKVLYRIGGIAQLARAPALQAGGRRFDSDYLHKKPDLRIRLFLLSTPPSPLPPCLSLTHSLLVLVSLPLHLLLLVLAPLPLSLPLSLPLHLPPLLSLPLHLLLLPFSQQVPSASYPEHFGRKSSQFSGQSNFSEGSSRIPDLFSGPSTIPEDSGRITDRFRLGHSAGGAALGLSCAAC